MLSKKLISLIKKNITIIDDSREIPSEVIDELVNENYFRLLLPKTYGGLEINFLEYLEIVTEVASYDASLAWCINQSNVLATNAAFMDKVLAEKIFSDKNTIISNGPPEFFEVKDNSDGIVVSGKWSFSSGIKNSNWVLAIYTDKNKENKNIMMPVNEVIMEDVWNVNGLRGTGSFSFSVKDKFIKNENIFYDRKNLKEKGPIYKIPRDLKFASGFSTIALSLANSGYKTITFDFLGHGRHFEAYSGNIVDETGATKLFVKQTKDLIDYFLDKNNSDNKISFNRLVGAAHWSPGNLPENCENGLRETIHWTPPQLSPPNNKDQINGSLAYGFVFDAVSYTHLTLPTKRIV